MERTVHPIDSVGRRRVVVAGSFAPDTASAPTDLYGKGFTVARTSAGIFTVTLEQIYGQLDSAIATLQLATAADQFAQVGAVSLSAKTFVIHTWDVSGNAVADIAANANNRVNFEFVFRASGEEV